MLPDELPPIFLGGQPAAHGRELLLSEWHLPAATLTRYLDEAWRGAGSYLAGKGFAVTHCSITKGPGKVGRGQS